MERINKRTKLNQIKNLYYSFINTYTIKFNDKSINLNIISSF